MKVKSIRAILGALCIALIAVFIVCLGIGRYSISFFDTIKVLLSPILGTGSGLEPNAFTVVFNYRLPRLIVALMVGGGLAVSGAAFQSLFSNALATPDTLGVVTGACFGAVLGLYFGLGMVWVQILAVIMGLIALTLTFKISMFKGKSSIIMMVLGGMVVSALFRALVSLVKFTCDQDEVLPSISFWLMGSLSSSSYKSLVVSLPFAVIGMIVIFALRWRLNIVSLSEDEAKALGMDVKKIRIVIMIAATMITASAVSMCGQIGWVGLLVPHIVRMIFGGNNKYVVPASIVVGSIFMLIIDTVARSATSAEIPLSILTAIIGAPLFITLLRKTGGIRT